MQKFGWVRFMGQCRALIGGVVDKLQRGWLIKGNLALNFDGLIVD